MPSAVAAGSGLNHDASFLTARPVRNPGVSYTTARDKQPVQGGDAGLTGGRPTG